MSATTYSIAETKLKQGSIQVERDAFIRTLVYLYDNSILTHLKQEVSGVTTESILLDVCDKPTLTTMRAMNRGLRQFGFQGSVVMRTVDNESVLFFRNPEGDEIPIYSQLTIKSNGDCAYAR